MQNTITFKGAPLALVGRVLKIGSLAPDFKVTSQDLKEVSLHDFKDKIKIVTSFPSLDTPVCDLQVKEFNKKALNLSADIIIIGISKDLPFAQRRFCESFDIKNVSVLSDYKNSSFGINYGLLIKELNLLARSVNIIDKNNFLRYSQVVKELTSPPDYDGVLKALEEVAKNPGLSMEAGQFSKCVPCEKGALPMAGEKIQKLIAQYRGWALAEDKKIIKEYKFKDFADAKYFVDLVSFIAEEQGHHPTVTIIYNKVRITLTTHAAGGLTDNDFIMARLIDELGSGEE